MSWNAIIVRKVVHGFGEEALDLFEKMSCRIRSNIEIGKHVVELLF